ncbi:tRNA pseudouridine(13) synthase TruD [Sulfurovum sp.]|uniref:tRNA pseudouridine(13) synthase TruD n=1 Tax=Sulfurovum sp. TaxID=1969726 RepID=UPI0025EB8715|nr:tRNA pseudouridine(13) synthase TruD [Sulfurovum sp.]
MKLIYPLNVKNEFVFSSSPRDFTVEEIPLYEFTGEGEHLVLKVRKKEMTTWEMIDAISSHIGLRRRDIGYAGLKDKHAMTIQYISLPAKLEEKLSTFSHEKIKILETTRHNNKIRVGHLKGNRFSIRLKKVLGVQKDKLDSVLKWIKNNGVPNYFGNQRFGTNGNNWEDGKKLIEGRLKMRDRKTREFLMGSYQSYLFNQWLCKRMELNLLLEKFSEEETAQVLKLPKGSLAGTKSQANFFKLLEGDLMMHYPYGRLFEVEELSKEAERFSTKDIAPTGLIPGSKTKRASGAARLIEAQFDEEMKLYGARRYAWIRVTEIKKNYVEEKAHYELSFALPKGAYATNVLDVLRGENAF